MGADDPLSSVALNSTEDEMMEMCMQTPHHDKSHLGSGPSVEGRTPEVTEFAPTSVNTVASYGQLLSATAYEDATLFDAVEIQPGNAPADSKPAAPATAVTVDDPVKKVENTIIPGMSGGYVTYRVSTKTSLEFASKEVSVRRRFRDFVALHDLLKATHRGYIIPPRPEKNTVEGQRASEEFVEGRRASLQRYLNQLASHPVIGQSQELRVFLESEGPLNASLEWQQLQPLQGSFLDGAVRLPKQLIGARTPSPFAYESHMVESLPRHSQSRMLQVNEGGRKGTVLLRQPPLAQAPASAGQERSIPSPTESAQSTKAAGDLLRRFKELRQSVRNEHVEPPRLDAEETSLRDEARQLEELQERVAEASKRAERVVAKMDEAGSALGDFGLSLIKLSKFEDEEGSGTGPHTQQGAASRSLAADCKRTGMAAVRLSRLAKVANEQAISALEPLHTNLALCPAALKALREREAQLLTVQAIEVDIAKKHKALATLEEQGQRTFGNDAQRGRKQDVVQNDLSALEMAHESAETELQKITSRNREELSRWEAERRSDFSAMQEAFLRVQTAFQDRNLSVWLETAEEFGASRPYP